MKKKFLSMVFMTVFFTLLLVGCGGTETGTEAKPEESQTTETQSEIETEIEIETEAESEMEQEKVAFAEAPESYYYEYVLAADGVEQVAFKIWSDGKRVKFEGGMEGEIYYLDYEKEEAYLYMPNENMMMKMPMEGMDSGWDSPFMMAAQIETDVIDGLNKVGEEEIDGKECTMYQYDFGQGKYTYAVWKDQGFIIKMIMELDGQPTYEYYFKDLTINENFEIDLELPEDVQIIGG